MHSSIIYYNKIISIFKSITAKIGIETYFKQYKLFLYQSETRCPSTISLI